VSLSTIGRVAERAGVGVGTVSRVLNDSTNVRPETRARVLAVIEELGYRPNRSARALAGGRTLTVGVVAPFFTQPSAVERLRGVCEVLDERGYDLVLLDVVPSGDEHERLRRLVAGQVDGLLVVSLPEAAVHDPGVPVVLVDATAERTPCVWVDDERGGRLAAAHLLELGHRRVAFLGDPPRSAHGFTSSEDRLRGFAAGLAAAGAPLPPELVRRGPHRRDEAQRLAVELLALPEPPTAVFAASDTQALGVREAALRAGLTVPRDLSVVGFDDVELAAHVGLTTVRQPLHESGRRGCALLLDRVARPPAQPRHPLEASATMSVELPLRLVARESTAPPGPNTTRRR
jgi:LacI family transcriptional regulator